MINMKEKIKIMANKKGHPWSLNLQKNHIEDVHFLVVNIIGNPKGHKTLDIGKSRQD
jgi:hypothetical protein